MRALRPSTLPAAAALLAAALAGCPATGPDDKKSCQKLTDCSPGEACKGGFCEALPCGGTCDDDQTCLNEVCKDLAGLACADDPTVCGSKFSCDPSGKCAQKCNDDNECQDPALPRCNVDTFVCGECSANADCAGKAGRPFCDSRAATCVGCIDNRSCDVGGAPTGKYCDDATKTCKTGCDANGDCPDGKTCKGATATVVGRCIECEPDPGDSLAGDTDCQVRNPKIQCRPDTNLCVQCLKTEHCAVGEQCDTTRNVCVQCLKNSDCAEGNVCNTESNLCVVGCTGGVGGPNCPEILPACLTTATADFPRGQCVQCLTSSDCPPNGSICKGNQCVPGCIVNGTLTDARCPDDVPYCGPADSVHPDGKCIQCKRDEDCSDASMVCDKPDSGGNGFCRCRKAGEACTTTNDCGFDGWNVDGRTPKCVKSTDTRFSSLKSYCVTKSMCGNPGDADWNAFPSGVCVVRSTANPGESCDCSGTLDGRCSPDFGSGVTRSVDVGQGNTQRLCVKSTLSCQ